MPENRKFILIADVTEGRTLARKALEADYDIVFAKKKSEAIDILIASENGRRFNLVIAGVHFDDSAMFQLLEYIRSVDHFDLTPFLPIQAVKSETGVLQKSIDHTLQILGSCSIVQLDGLPEENAITKLRSAVSAALQTKVAYKRIDYSPRNPIGSESEKELRDKAR